MLTLVANLAIGTLLGVSVGLSPGVALGEGLMDAILSLGLLLLALRALNRTQRFLQTATALLGCGAMLSFLAIPPLILAASDGQQGFSVLAGLVLLVLLGWNIVVIGHVLRHAFDLQLGQGVAIAVIYSLLSYSLISGIAPSS